MSVVMIHKGGEGNEQKVVFQNTWSQRFPYHIDILYRPPKKVKLTKISSKISYGNIFKSRQKLTFINISDLYI